MGKTFEELIQVKIIQELLPLQPMWLHILSNETKLDICWHQGCQKPIRWEHFFIVVIKEKINKKYEQALDWCIIPLISAVGNEGRMLGRIRMVIYLRIKFKFLEIIYLLPRHTLYWNTKLLKCIFWGITLGFFNCAAQLRRLILGGQSRNGYL